MRKLAMLSSFSIVTYFIFLSCLSRSNREDLPSGETYSFDSAFVFLTDTTKKCFDCYDFAELFVSINNDTKEDVQMYFRKTQDSIKYDATFFLGNAENSYELTSNESNSITIKKKSSVNLLLSLEAQRLRLSQKSNRAYRNLIYKLLNAHTVYYTTNISSRKFIKSKGFKIITK
jgi:hypothetical protein